MIKKSIQNPGLFEISDGVTHSPSFGFNQEWYPTRWQRLSGCGPTAVSNIIYYLQLTQGGAGTGQKPFAKSDCQALMEEVWKHVTPRMRGIPSTSLLLNEVRAYAKSKALDLKLDFIDVPSVKPLRPELDRLLSFIGGALQNNTPVAFLNLNNGEEKMLDSWHWVTIISLEYAEDGSAALAEILDEGMIKKIDLALWLKTTTRGGGFVSFRLP